MKKICIFKLFLLILTVDAINAIEIPIHLRDRTTTTASFPIESGKLFSETQYTLEIQTMIRDAFDAIPIPLSAFNPIAYSIKLNANSQNFAQQNSNLTINCRVYLQYGNNSPLLLARTSTPIQMSLLNNEYLLEVQTNTNQVYKNIVNMTMHDPIVVKYDRVDLIVQVEFPTAPVGLNVDLDFAMYTQINYTAQF